MIAENDPRARWEGHVCAGLRTTHFDLVALGHQLRQAREPVEVRGQRHEPVRVAVQLAKVDKVAHRLRQLVQGVVVDDQILQSDDLQRDGARRLSA